MDSKTETVSDFKKDIDEIGDIMIADFIGKRVWDKKLMKDGRDQQWELPMCIGYYPTVKTMKFKTSWDWLMPVVINCHKVGDAKEKEFNATDSDLDDPKGWRAWSYRRVGLSTNINQVYKNVLTFIHWYNSQSPATIK